MELKARAAIYTRVSTREQAKEGYSIGEQEERLKAYAVSRGYDVVKVFTDPGYSGSNMKRPGLENMVDSIKQGYLDIVLVYKLDRLSRSQKDTLYLIEEIFLKNTVDFISISESFDTSTSFGRAMIGILSVFAQFEREQIRERSLMGREARAKKGKYHGGGGMDRVVTGYDYVDGKLIINEYESEYVKFVFDQYNKGIGTQKINRLAHKKFPAINPNESTIRNILKNPIYIGKITNSGQVYQGLHQPIITESLFAATQELIKKRVSKSEPYKKRFLLTGMIYCGYCESRMFGKTGSKLKDGTSLQYYICYSRQGKSKEMIKKENCMKKYERKELLESRVIREVKKLNIDFVKNHQRKNSRSTNDLNKEKIMEIESQMNKIIELYSLDQAPIELITERLDKLTKQRDDLHKAIKANSKPKDNKTKEINNIVSSLSKYDWSNNNLDQQRVLLSKLIDQIIIKDDEVTIEWSF